MLLLRESFAQIAQSKPLRALLVTRALSSGASLSIAPYLVLYLIKGHAVTAIVATVMVSAVAISGRFISLPIGRAVDSRGPRQIIVLANLMGLASAVAFWATSAFGGLFFIVPFVLQTIAFAGLNVAYRVYAGLLTSAAARPVNFTFLSLSFNLGSIVGAAGAGWLVKENSYAGMFAFASVLYFLSSLVAFGLPNTESATVAGSTSRESSVNGRSSLPNYDAAFQVFCLVSMATAALLQQIVTGLAAYLQEFSGHAELTSVFYVLQSTLLLTLLPFVGLRFKGRHISFLYGSYCAGTLVLAAGYLVFAAVPATAIIWGVATLALFAVVSQLLAMPTVDSIVFELAGTTAAGKVMGKVASANATGALLGAVASGFFLQSASTSRSARLIWVIPALVCGLVTLYGAIKGHKLLEIDHTQRAEMSVALR